MTIAVHILAGSGRLEPHRNLLARVASEALQLVGERLPLTGVDVVLQDLPASTIPDLAIGGYAPTAHLLQVSLDPAAERFVEKVELHLPRTLAHEWHHCARWRGPGYGTTLGEALVSEGLADHFDLELFGGEPYPWTRALNDDQAREWWARAATESNRPNYDHARWFFNRGTDGPPFHAGYALGFRLVAAYLARHPGSMASELWTVSAEEVLAGSAA